MSAAIILGNGESRKEFENFPFYSLGTVYACNAYYRNHAWDAFDFLVAIDDGIIAEIKASGFPQERFVVPPLDERWEPAECNRNRPRGNAGFAALREALKAEFTDVFLFGFDFMLGDPTKSVSNLYDGTANYGPQTRANHADNPGRVNYLNWIARQYPSATLWFVFPDISNIRSVSEPNIRALSSNDFFETISSD